MPLAQVAVSAVLCGLHCCDVRGRLSKRLVPAQVQEAAAKLRHALHRDVRHAVRRPWPSSLRCYAANMCENTLAAKAAACRTSCSLQLPAVPLCCAQLQLKHRPMCRWFTNDSCAPCRRAQHDCHLASRQGPRVLPRQRAADHRPALRRRDRRRCPELQVCLRPGWSSTVHASLAQSNHCNSFCPQCCMSVFTA
jgi:hypothetical protein